ncbi:MAG TPA: fatty-acid--CoA ligase [Desulfobulbaceae bacterium]|nr:fatty-acid--CoA ligase [Desulfobulbaceae bacterium]
MYLTQGLHRAVQQKADNIATLFGTRQTTFRQLADRVARLAGALQNLGMQPGDRVAMLAQNSDYYLEYQMAVPWGAGVLNPCNTRWSAAEILYALEDSGSLILIVDETFRAMAQTLRDKTSTVREFVYCGDGPVPKGMHGYEALIAKTAPVEDALRRGNDLAGIFYTGGTTGFPKGVMLTHTNMISSGLALLGERFAKPDAVYLHAAPMFHLADIGMAMPHWIEGNTHTVIPSFSPVLVLDTIERHRVTHVLLIPTMIQMLVDHPAMREPRDLSSLQVIVYGASAITEAVLDRAMDALPGIEFMQAYGMTELAPVVSVSPGWAHQDEGRKVGKHRSGGRAIYCSEIRIVDPEGRKVPLGTTGEIIARGPNVMLGYWGKPELTAAVLRNGWMHTGDAGYMEKDGFIYVVDRLKDMIISGGENVYSAEVENAITQHPSVATCAVIGVPDDKWGESVHAVVVLKAGMELTAEALTAHVKSLIAGYKCPRSVEFREELPLSGAGKLLKTMLRKPFWEGHERQVH